MSTIPLAIARTALRCAVGRNAAAACAAIRAGINVSADTRFHDSGREWIRAAMTHEAGSSSGVGRLADLLMPVIEDCLEGLSGDERAAIPVLFCLSEPMRPGRPAELDRELFAALAERHGYTAWAEQSAVIASGKVSGILALAHARRIIGEGLASRVLIAAVDSLIQRETLSELESQDRLLTSLNSNGFIPGEAASAVLVTEAGSDYAEVCCLGIGFGQEAATIASDMPLRADGLVKATLGALDEAACELAGIDVRISDLSGEHYYFKEASLALARLLRAPRDDFPLWHPAQSIGEVGAAVGPALIAVAHAALAKQYSPGPSVIVQCSNDSGERAAAILRYTGA